MGEKEDKPKDQLLIKLRKIMKKGDKKSSTFAAEEALKFYKRSLDGLKKLPETPENISDKVQMQLLLAEILFILGRWDPALSYLSKVQDMGPEKAGAAQVAEAYRKSGGLWALKGDIDHVFQDYEKALTLSKALKDKAAIADAERGLGYAHWRRGNVAEAELHYQKAFAFLKGTNEDELLAKTQLESGNVYNDKGDLDKAVDYYMKAIRVFRKSKDIYQEARGYNNLGDVCIKRKDWKKGIRYFKRTASLADSINDLHMQGWALFNAAECQAKDGNLEEAEECCTKSLDMLSRIDDKIGIAYVFCNYGIVYRFKKEWAKSIKYFKFSLNIVKNIGTPGLEAYVLKEYADMQNDRGKKDKAKELAREALMIYSKMGAKYYIEMINEILARIEGRDYHMDVKMSERTIRGLEEESMTDEPETKIAAQEPILFNYGIRKRVAKEEKAKTMAFTDEGPRPVPSEGTQSPTLAQEPRGSKVGSTIEDQEVPSEDRKVYLFMPSEVDEGLRRQKVRFYVELPFVAPDLEVEEVQEGDGHDGPEGIREYPSVMLMGKIFPGIPSAKTLLDEVRTQRIRSRGPNDKALGPKAAGTANIHGKAGPPLDRSSVSVAGGSEIAKPHYSYLLEDENHDRAFRIFKRKLSEGAKGLVISRPPVQKIKDLFGLEDAEFILLSTSETPRKGLHPIKEISDLERQIESFMEIHDVTVVLLDRSDTIIGHLGFDQFLRMVHTLNECIETCKSTLLVPLDPQLIGNMEIRTLRKEFSNL